MAALAEEGASPAAADDDLEGAGLVATSSQRAGRSQMYEVTEGDGVRDDSATAQRRARMDAKMAARAAARSRAAAERRADRDEHKDPNQTATKFWNDFNALGVPVQEELDAVSEACQGEPSAPQQQQEQKKKKKKKKNLLNRLSPLAAQLDAMQKLVAGASYFLPAYDSRSAAQQIKKLRAQLAATKSEVEPKKKFSFRARMKKKNKKSKKSKKSREKKSGNDDDGQGEPPASESSESSTAATATAAAAAKTEYKGAEPAAAAAAAAAAATDYIVAERRGETIRVEVETLREWSSGDPNKSSDVVLTHLEDCTVYLGAPMSALRIDNLKNCRVFGGPVRGSLLLEHCEDCTLWLASRQIRLHNSVRCTFHLRVMSNPIIEDCTELLFAPYNMRYEALEAQLEASDLGSVKTGMWSRVQDFKWHRAQHSPHWAELPPAQWVLEARCEGVELMSQPLRLPRDEDQGEDVRGGRVE